MVQNVISGQSHGSLRGFSSAVAKHHLHRAEWNTPSHSKFSERRLVISSLSCFRGRNLIKAMSLFWGWAVTDTDTFALSERSREGRGLWGASALAIEPETQVGF